MSNTPRVDALLAKHRHENETRLVTRIDDYVQQVRELITLARDLEQAARPEEPEGKTALNPKAAWPFPPTRDERDAARYRWLKANHLQTGPDSWIRTGDDLEEAIDAAMRDMNEERS